MKISFANRSTLPELMDAPGVPEAAVAITLKELAVIARLLGGYAVTISALNKISSRHKLASILDIGFGGGDNLRAIAGWARRSQQNIRLSGIDRNPFMARYAQEHSKGFPEIAYNTADVFDDALLEHPADVVMSSLFCHHFDDDDLVKLLQRQLALCRIAVVVNDLHRHPVAYYSIKMLTRLFAKSKLMQYDACLSVARSFTRRDWLRILAAAGITKYSLKWRWAWRWQLIIPKQALQFSQRNG